LKIAMIGAGSYGWIQATIKDFILLEGFPLAQIVLMDLDTERLKLA